MIWIYHADNVDYDHNGDCAPMPESCETDSTLNGSWELTLIHPIDPEGRYKDIVEGAVLSVPTQQGDRQRYRIYHKEKSDTEVTAYARPVFFDSADEVFLMDKRPTEKNGQEALNLLLEGTGYTGLCNITKKETAYYVRKNLMEALQGQEDQSFLSRWGGEILYDNKKISILDHAGSFKGARAEFGYNLESVKESVNLENVITRIVPVAYNGYTLPGGAPWIDSPNIGKYPVIHIRTVEYPEIKMKEDAGEDEEGFETKEELWEALRKAAQADFEAGCDLPEVNYQVNLIDLSQTEEYRNYKDLEKVNLGDSVYCHHAPLDIEVMARVISIKWDCILNRVAEITLGNYRTSYFDQVTSTYNQAKDLIDQNGNLIADRVVGVMDAMQVQLKQQIERAEKNKKPAVIFEVLNPEDPLYGAMAMGTQGWIIAKQRKEDGSWDWKTAATANGMVADLIKVGTMLADRIKGGTLTLGGEDDKDGRITILDEKGETVGYWGSKGIRSVIGSISTYSDKKDVYCEIQGGRLDFHVKATDEYYGTGLSLGIQTREDGAAVLDFAEIVEPITPGEPPKEHRPLKVDMGVSGTIIHGQEGCSGTAEFSNGTSLKFVGGILVGGITEEGAF